VPARLSVALALRWYREREGLSQTQAARRVKASKAFFADVENPDVDVLLSEVERAFLRLGLGMSVQFTEALTETM